MIREQAIAQLCASERGRSAIRQMLAWLDNDGIGLDAANQQAAVALLIAAWEKPGSTRDLMRLAIESTDATR